MLHKISFINLNAVILTSNLIDKKIAQATRYDYEKREVSEILNALKDVESVPLRSRALVKKLLGDKLRRWWSDSWFNVQIDMAKSNILHVLIDKLREDYAIVAVRSRDCIIVENITDTAFADVCIALKVILPSLDIYRQTISEVH